jgi:hypothetical protein
MEFIVAKSGLSLNSTNQVGKQPEITKNKLNVKNKFEFWVKFMKVIQKAFYGTYLRQPLAHPPPGRQTNPRQWGMME